MLTFLIVTSYIDNPLNIHSPISLSKDVFNHIIRDNNSEKTFDEYFCNFHIYNYLLIRNLSKVYEFSSTVLSSK